MVKILKFNNAKAHESYFLVDLSHTFMPTFYLVDTTIYGVSLIINRLFLLHVA